MGVLLEREAASAVLREAVERRAPFVLVAGEAGSGKSSLVRHVLDGLNRPWVLGACDSLSTARPLGPFEAWNGPAEQVLRGVDVAVVEDVHWADDATLELLARLSRREASSTVVLTYRDDEVGPSLTMLLGDLATRSPVRLAVPRLSRDAVRELVAGTDVDPVALHHLTGGNPFFVTECLATGSVAPSANVRDAVLARVARLENAAREAVTAVSAVPGTCELWLAEALGAEPSALDAATEHGLLVASGNAVSLRHELARQAVHDALPPARRRDLHRAAAAALAARHPVDHARVVHHAALGDDGDLLQAHALPAAERALALGARSQAVEHLELAVAHAPEDAALRGRWAEQLASVGRDDDAVRAYEEAVRLAQAASDSALEADLLTRMPGPLSTVGRLEDAGVAVFRAIALLEKGEHGPPLARAYLQVLSQHMLAREFGLADSWGEKALALARRVGDAETEALARIQLGTARWMAGAESGLAMVRDGMELGRRHGFEWPEVLGLLQIGSGGGEIRRYDEALPALEECCRLCADREMGSRGRYAQAWLGRCLLELGRWDEAARLLEPLLASPRTEAVTRVTAMTALGRLRARRGDPGARALLDEALDDALRTGQLQRIWPVAAARAEEAWLADRIVDEVPLLRRAYGQAALVGYPWAVDELGFWLARADVEVAWRPRTAEEWSALGCLYEAALVEPDELAALAAFEKLGATAVARLVVERRRRAGLSVPRGPNAATRGTPGGLTSRELDVLRLVAQGHTNAEIAAALHLSVKTVGHHVSHVLEKLGAATRTEAVARAAALDVPLK